MGATNFGIHNVHSYLVVWGEVDLVCIHWSHDLGNQNEIRMCIRSIFLLMYLFQKKEIESTL